jgi:acyl-CoA dehydrogenase
MDLGRLLVAEPPAVTTLRGWWDATAVSRAREATTIDRALVGGALADRMGFAFAGGYSEALRALVPGLDGITALCATEEGGNQPRAIKTTLVGNAVTGKKKWATAASDASALLVVASIGEQDGKNRLRVVRVPANARGVTLRMTSAPFVPEIPHAEVELDGAIGDVLPGDGYDDYLKPFRTVEDLHVHAALAGYLAGVARRYHFAVEPALALAAATRGLADADVKAPATHLALAGLIEEAARVVAAIEAAWPDGEERQRWQRDRALLQVAGKARAARLERARATLS